MAEYRDVFAYDCPSQGIDFDISPPPVYGSMIQCSACGGQHRADETLGCVHRYFEDDRMPLDLTDEWIVGR